MAGALTPGVAVVTGASSGIGRAFARELATRGWRVVAVARDGARLDALLHELPGDHHEALPADLTTAAGCAAVAARIEAGATLLVNAAGSGTTRPLPDAPLEQEVTQVELNVTALLRLSHAAARALRERGQAGAIVNVASTAALWSTGTYAASKRWVVTTTEGLAVALAGTPVRVLCVVPGFTRTEFHQRSGVDNSGIPGWLWLTAEQVAAESLDALDAGRQTVVPGRRYRVLTRIAGALPAPTRRKLIKRLAPLSAAQD